MEHPAHRYGRAILPFRLGHPNPGAEPGPASRPEAAPRLLRSLERSGKSALLLLGLGSGALARELAACLVSARLLVCEPDPERVRQVEAAGLLDWWTPASPHQLVVDASPWAQRLLWRAEGVQPAEALATPNPELDPTMKKTLDPFRRLAALDTERFFHVAPRASRTAPTTAFAAILHPDEPGLKAFFAQIPDWITSICLVWDAERVPQPDLPRDERFREIAVPLHGDFGAQRTRLLELCDTQWVVMLDGDETLAPDLWERLPALMVPDIDGYWLPRLTWYPDADHVLAGYGLWPDLQLRLFRNAPHLRFVRAVHERLEGLSGPTCLVFDAPIGHHSRLRKSESELAAKLAGFDAAGGGAVRHRLAAEYPHLPVDFFEHAGADGFNGLVLPPGWGV
jgi:hypothetical protein